ncbi:MAG: 3-dehydroquinate synthase [Verrucomicrobia bacterium]|nr:3-dehydroquinate synthase [Verrucomicrobiota bacterium]
MAKLELHPNSVRTHIVFAHGCFKEVVTSELARERKVAVVADPAVVEAAKELSEHVFVLSGGEASKTRENKQLLEDELLKRGFGRDTLLIGIGGGVVTDMTAFLASTYMRGVPLVLIPTTLLAMVDASLGGKTAVDTPFGKNLIGSFYHPRTIYIDFDFLKSLPKKEKLNGLAEMLKYGLIWKKEIWDQLKNRTDPESLIEACASSKISIVKEDPEEKGLRRILNFGHTIGHALEYQSHYKIPHGEAVAIGCLAESHMSMELGYLPKQSLEEIVGVFKAYKFPLKIAPPANRFWEALAIDKKGIKNEARFVLLDEIGHCLPFDGHYCRTVPKHIIEQTLHWIQHGPLSHPAS